MSAIVEALVEEFLESAESVPEPLPAPPVPTSEDVKQAILARHPGARVFGTPRPNNDGEWEAIVAFPGGSLAHMAFKLRLASDAR
jgi:hypothetical protein